MFLLDTCVLSELVKKKPSDTVIKWLGRAEENMLFLSVLTLGEIRKGIAKSADPRRKKTLTTWLENDLRERFVGRILPVSDAVAEVWGDMQGEAEKIGRGLPAIDGLIAATALHHGLTVVTRNGKDMEASGVEIVDPW